MMSCQFWQLETTTDRLKSIRASFQCKSHHFLNRFGSLVACLIGWLVDLVCALVGWLEGGLWLVDGHVGCWMSG